MSTAASHIAPGTGGRAARAGATITRNPSLPLPNRLNLCLTVVVAAGLLGLLWLASHLVDWIAILAVGIGFSYLQLTNYALLHEATHDNLNERPVWNYWLGWACGLGGAALCATFLLYRASRNRTVFLVCAHCGQKNRLQKRRMKDRPIYGKHKTRLPRR